jgi:hypothetical protein
MSHLKLILIKVWIPKRIEMVRALLAEANLSNPKIIKAHDLFDHVGQTKVCVPVGAKDLEVGQATKVVMMSVNIHTTEYLVVKLQQQ